MIMVAKVVTLAATCMALIGCGGIPSDEVAATADETSTISWNDDLGKVRSAQITRVQREWLIDARARARQRHLDGQTPVRELPLTGGAHRPAGDLDRSASALIQGSTDWTDCANLEWFLLTSKPDGMGNAWCAREDTFEGVDTAVLVGHGPGSTKFVPKYYDAAVFSKATFILCRAGVAGRCAFGFGTTPWCPKVWNVYNRHSGTANISPPFDVYVINAQWLTPAGPPVCN